ncbi:DJ-1/PfpI family protein [Ulvibacter antarcticus]|uniref:DJ-1/PfpI family protein n=1 Tax=Ulvibacter antarcticus TaxID=442714 RepID=A0A3L9YEV8_9FLAO|nr:DJ-1/PfpI family protein [Ulvibacter antarcticus]RMA57890.1 DJ-1/PfpI family protein [Ulvibacter antarcticus]
MNIKYVLLVVFFGIISCGNPSEKKDVANTSEVDIIENSKVFPKLDTSRYNVGFLIMDGVYNTELTAPFDIFQHTIFRENIKAMNVFTVANTDKPIRSFEGMRILPDFNYLKDSIPIIDILVIPSAEHHLDSDLEDQEMLNFVRRTNKDAQFMTSHCDGAFVLAKAGLLDKTVSTTFPSDIDAMRAMFPKLDIRKDVLFVHDGKYITSAGGAKSFEAALYLCEFLYGKEIAQSLAGGLVIDWELENVPHLIIEKTESH